ncbi:hypothetical protein [Carnobacterium jeotgali]|uniref:hypothetical protein n=1 Tax=Carnobacterium jeotgali TaxID=545534 RepID=UPI000690B64E|nr:hypothetical protein [Carnobacterium jeotgali]
MIDREKTFKAIQFGINPLGALLYKGSEALIDKATTVAEKGSIEDLKKEAKKQNYLHQIRSNEAKLAQELAISQRISTAEIVEIEEYYEGEGSGSLGVKFGGGIPAADTSGSGRKVTKRIYKFTGFNGEVIENQENFFED